MRSRCAHYELDTRAKDAGHSGTAGTTVARKTDNDAINFKPERKNSQHGETVATAAGRAAHRAADFGPGYIKEFRLPSGKKVDAVNLELSHVIELKPDNPRAIRRGKKQLQQYLQELEDLFGRQFTGEVRTYRP